MQVKFYMISENDQGVMSSGEDITPCLSLSFYEFAQQCGCDIAPGFFYDKPLPVREFENRLDTRKYTNSQVS